MGRGIETRADEPPEGGFLASAARELRGSFRPTPKNPPAAGFYEREGFRLAEEREGGEKLYVLGRQKAAPAGAGGSRWW